MGICLPNPGEAHINGVIVPEEKAYEEAAKQFLMAKVPTLFPGPLSPVGLERKGGQEGDGHPPLVQHAQRMRAARANAHADPDAGLPPQVPQDQS